jgi:hypothetical protein
LSLAPDFAAFAIATFEAIPAEERFIRKHFALPAVRCVAASFLKNVDATLWRKCFDECAAFAQAQAASQRFMGARDRYGGYDRSSQPVLPKRALRHCRGGSGAASVRPRPAGAIERG